MYRYLISQFNFNIEDKTRLIIWYKILLEVENEKTLRLYPKVDRKFLSNMLKIAFLLCFKIWLHPLLIWQIQLWWEN